LRSLKLFYRFTAPIVPESRIPLATDHWRVFRIKQKYGDMSFSSRRSFMLRAGCTAAASICILGERAAAREGASRADTPPELQSLVAPERRKIAESMATEDIPGAAVCFIDAGKIWIEGFGVTDRVSNRRVSTDTIFSIQSTSKNLTATAIMLAVQRGLLDLDQPIAAYLPDFTVQSRFEPAPQQKMTLRHLLSHRAGFTHEAPVGNNYEPAFPDFAAHVRSISQTWLRYPVGERYRYSNLGFDLAGYILQVRSGMPFAQWLKTMLFEPLGMSSSTAATDVYVRHQDRAVGHEAGYTTVPLKTPLIPSGGVYTSARDIAAYCQFHLDRGKARGGVVLREELWNEMHGFSFGGDYSLGVIRSELRHGDTAIRLLSHRGGGFGFGSVFDYCPEAGLAWVALFNRPVSAAYSFGAGLIQAALTQRYGARKPRLPVTDLAPIEPTQEQLQQFVGNYVGRNITTEITLQGRSLGMQAAARLKPMQFTSPSEAFVEDSDADTVTYQYSAAGHLEPAHFECSIGEDSLDYNDGPQDVVGPDKPAWAAFLGQYRIDQWGRESQTVTIHRKNGYLYLDHIRLIIELEPSLFFTCDGEAVDFGHGEPTWRSIRLRRVAGA
jgi:CubicO group peptidase (beta-lactamase class C family)